jgi:hypothetical protein
MYILYTMYPQNVNSIDQMRTSYEPKVGIGVSSDIER